MKTGRKRLRSASTAAIVRANNILRIISTRPPPPPDSDK